MRLFWVLATAGAAALGLAGQDYSQEAWRLELKGEAVEAGEQLRRAAASAPKDPLALQAYAEFLDRHRDPGARGAYEQLRAVLASNGASATERAKIARRLAELDLLASDREAAARHLDEFRSLGGSGLELPPVPAPEASRFGTRRFGTIEIPGPLRSFARMAAVSPDLAAEEFMSALAHNIVLNGYSASRASESLEPTEYLKLVIRYLSQAREIEKLAGPDKILRIDMCESAMTGDLLRVLGYRMRGACGSDVALETVNPSRAFLTIDSGFPISELESALRTNRPFRLDFSPARVPVLYGTDYWTAGAPKQGQPEFIDFFLGDPSIARLYSALSAMDPDTADQIQKDMPAVKAKIYAHVLDFFGTMFEVRNGRAVVPGGARSEKAWADLAGVSPEKGAAFFERMIERDDGWLASYFDSLARINGPAQAYLTEPERLKRFYSAIRGRVTSPGPARPVFRANTDLVLLTTRLRLDPDGKPHLPGGLDVWKNLFTLKSQAKIDPKLAKAAPGWKDSEEVLEAMFGLCRKIVDNEPLKIFMLLTEVERNREKPLDVATVDLLVREAPQFGAQYPLFSESPTISGSTIRTWFEAARAVNQIHDVALRSDAAGTMQALTGFWQIFVRQKNIAPSNADASLDGILKLFLKLQGQRDVLEAGIKGVHSLLQAAGAPAGGSVQDHMMDLLAGTRPAQDGALSEAQSQMLQEMVRIFEAQRLVSLDTLFAFADGLASAAGGQKPDAATMHRLAARISEIPLPRNPLSVRERTEMSAGYWIDRHIDSERKLNLRAALDKAGNDPQKLQEIRASLLPVLRDTLVGLNYIHYAPPGAQVLFTNPVFVRSHDFFGNSEHPRTWASTDVMGSGWPANAGGRLVGSLAGLPYALAQSEQNFLIPSREQALIWGDLVPQMMLSAVIPRWWNVKPAQLHWVGLHMAYAESALAEAAMNETQRNRVLAVLDRYVSPARLKKIQRLLASGDVHAAADNVVPSEMYQLARETAPEDKVSALAEDIRKLQAEFPQDLSPAAISGTFGTPKPLLSNSYRPELLNLRTFPTLMGYSSRILAESWESNLLFYAALADEIHLQPADLNLRVPEWTQQTVEHIFATHLEDWPALLRSLRLVGDGVRQKARKQMLARTAQN
jgi:hypothetical protein